MKRTPKKVSGLNVQTLGQRWVAGESIRLLASEAELPWNELQAKLRAAGYLRSHKVRQVPLDAAAIAASK